MNATDDRCCTGLFDQTKYPITGSAIARTYANANNIARPDVVGIKSLDCLVDQNGIAQQIRWCSLGHDKEPSRREKTVTSGCYCWID